MYFQSMVIKRSRKKIVGFLLLGNTLYLSSCGFVKNFVNSEFSQTSGGVVILDQELHGRVVAIHSGPDGGREAVLRPRA